MFRFPGRQSSSGGSSRQTQRINRIDVEPATGTATAQKKKKKGGTTADLPTKLKRVRACMICSLIKTESEFEEDGCDNCEAFLHLKGTKGAVLSYTSANFEGMIAMIQPEESWVARWQRIVDQWVKDELTDAGLPYVCRDKTQISEAKRDKLTHKRKRNRRRKPSSESVDDENHVPESTAAVPTRRMQQIDESEESGEPGPVNGGKGNADKDEAPVNPLIIKREPVDAPTDTASRVGNMPYRSGRRFSSSSSSSEESDAEPCSKGSYSP